MNIIISVMTLLEGLSNDIVSLVVFFQTMNAEIKTLVRRHKLHAGTARDLTDDMEQSLDGPLNSHDLSQFHKQLVDMKKASLVVNALSSLYADVINNAINPGFAQVMAASHADTSGQKSSLVVASKQLALKSYIESAEQTVMTKSRQANAELREKIAVIDEAEARRMSRMKKSKARTGPTRRPDTEPLRSGGGSFSTGARRSRFVRMFGRGSS